MEVGPEVSEALRFCDNGYADRREGRFYRVSSLYLRVYGPEIDRLRGMCPCFQQFDFTENQKLGQRGALVARGSGVCGAFVLCAAQQLVLRK